MTTWLALPEGWRHSPDTAGEGETTVGYFAPEFSRIAGRYGHVTLHYEDRRSSPAPMSLQEFVGKYVAYMEQRTGRISTPVFEQRQGMPVGRVAAQLDHRGQQVLLRAYFWTGDNRQFWYAISESLAEDGDFVERARPLILLLEESTRSGPN